MKEKLLYINTIGCQMNTYDSGRMAEALRPLGYRQVPGMEAADLVIVNTCAIREKAEQKVFSFLGRLAGLKRRKPGLIIGVGGCVAQQEGKRMLKRVPHLDLVFGTQALGRLPQLVGRVETERCRLVDVGPSPGIEDSIGGPNPMPQKGEISRFVTIMRGCDNYCTYCVVPYVRGRETSRSPRVIVTEVERLVDEGVREVTLLGQNVNSYGKKEGLCSFAELLGQVNSVNGLRRIRFTTSHPKDLSDELIQSFADLEKLCGHMHLPVQSGSNRILERMNRKYSREAYLERVARLRDTCPDIAITSDFIVGFPGEERVDFEETLALIKEVEYDGLFAFKYSDRPNAPAARFDDKLPEDEKQERLSRLLDLQKRYTLKKNRSLIGTVQEILVERPSRQLSGSSRGGGGGTGAVPPEGVPARQWSGRTTTNKIVHFPDVAGNGAAPFTNRVDAGILLDVKIEKAFAHSLRGKLMPEAARHSDGIEGDHGDNE